MLGEREGMVNHHTLWGDLAAPLPEAASAAAFRARLDAVVAGEWDLTLDLLPRAFGIEDTEVAFKARLQILGVIRESVGTAGDYKAAATDAFCEAAHAFRIGAATTPAATPAPVPAPAPNTAPARAERAATPAPAPAASPASVATNGEVLCPVCGGRTWDNRDTKRNPKAPDYKCRDRSCPGVIWPPHDSGSQETQPTQMDADPAFGVTPRAKQRADEMPFALTNVDDDDLPF